jgi:hypothetical protein
LLANTSGQLPTMQGPNAFASKPAPTEDPGAAYYCLRRHDCLRLQKSLRIRHVGARLPAKASAHSTPYLGENRFRQQAGSYRVCRYRKRSFAP